MVSGMSDSSTRSRRGSGAAGRLIKGLLAAALITAAITGSLHMRAALSELPAQREPLPVMTVPYQLQPGYTREAAYLGLVVAGRKADLGFELAGTLQTAPPRPGTLVERGEVIAALDASSLRARREATAAELEQARIELELARITAGRQKELIAGGAVSREAYDQTRLRSSALESRLGAMTAQLRMIDIDLEKSRLLAPYTGVVADRYVHQGAVVNPGAPVVRLVETTGQEAHIGIPASRAATLEVGQHYRLSVRNIEYQAELLSVRPDVNPITRTTTAVFAVPGEIAALDGESALLSLEEPVRASGGWLPMEALQEGKRGLWMVLRIDDTSGETRAVREAVEVIEIRGNQVFVRGSLPDNSLVIAGGVHRLSAGARVQPRPAN